MGVYHSTVRGADIVNIRMPMPNHSIYQFVHCCSNNNVSEVSRMISEGVDINGTYGLTGLQHAMVKNHSEIVKLLLAHIDIQLGVTNFEGSTALHFACAHNNVACVRLFLAHRFCTKDIVKMVNRDGRTAYMMDQDQGASLVSFDCARLVREYLEKVDKPAEVDFIQRMVEMIKSGENADEGATRLDEMTLTEVAEGIEKINAHEPIIEAVN